MSRPLVVRIVHVESDQTVSEHEIPVDMTGSELENWVKWLEATCEPDYVVEVPGPEAA